VVLLDLSLGAVSGLDLLKDIKTVRPKLPVLVLTVHPEEHFARRAFRAGADGYINKGSVREDLVEAIQRVLRGRRYVSPRFAEKMVGDMAVEAHTPLHEGLSDREFEVLRLIASGKTVGQAAELMSLSHKTVSTYRSRLLIKMQMTTNAELTRYAIQHGLVD
jgi:DNA-binding NarL/FixJ family response regulator